MSSTILVVEDDDDLRSSLVGVLLDSEFVAYSASNGQAALQLLETEPWTPDLIVSDIAMPYMDGYEFFENVHGIDALRAVPFIFLTARGTKYDLQVARKMGADDYLIKPVEPDELIDAVQNKLRRSKEIRQVAASELDDARRTMVQLLSHELRTPLTYVTGGFALLAEELNQSDLPPDANLSLGLIESGAARLNRLTEQMILYSQLAAGHVQIQMDTAGSPVNLKAILELICAIFQTDENNDNKTVSLEIAANEHYMVFGLADLLSAALSELVRNAKNFSNRNSDSLIQLFRDNDFAVVKVIDHGVGIISEDLPKVWKILVQSERSRREQQGAGMGLPIARKVIEVHGGTIALESVVNQGTTVTVRLPLLIRSA